MNAGYRPTLSPELEGLSGCAQSCGCSGIDAAGSWLKAAGLFFRQAGWYGLLGETFPDIAMKRIEIDGGGSACGAILRQGAP